MESILKDELYNNLCRISNGEIEVLQKETDKFLESIFKDAGLYVSWQNGNKKNGDSFTIEVPKK